nr:MAG TPA: protein of unknown function (DUF3858) [Caudoviricetes sp.]
MRPEKNCVRLRRSFVQPNVRWPGFARLSVMPAIASILTLVLFLAGCASTRETVKEISRTEAGRMTVDSLAKEVLLVRTEAVPKSEVRLAIPADSLMKLPPEASYSGKSGQANVSVSRDGDVIAVHASCDSLQILVEYYAGRFETYKNAYEEMADLYEAEVKRRSNPVQIFFYGFGAGILICVLVVILIQKQKKDGG